MKKSGIMHLVILFVTIVIAGMSIPSKAQDVAIKTNLIDDALLDVNLGVEVGVAHNWSIDVPASLNFWTLSHDRRWKHWAVQPGVRYWFCEAMGGHFVGAHLQGGQYNFGGVNMNYSLLGTHFGKLKDSRYEGWFVGAGVSYGYTWILHKHWNVEAEIGIGWAYTRYNRFPCTHCGYKLDSNRVHNYVGPTKAAINIEYVF